MTTKTQARPARKAAHKRAEWDEYFMNIAREVS